MGPLFKVDRKWVKDIFLLVQTCLKCFQNMHVYNCVKSPHMRNSKFLAPKSFNFIFWELFEVHSCVYTHTYIVSKSHLYAKLALIVNFQSWQHENVSGILKKK